MSELHPKGIFACQIIAFGEIRKSKGPVSSWLMTATLRTAKGDVFTTFSGTPNTLMAMTAAVPFYATRIWSAKVWHQDIGGQTMVAADVLWSRGSIDAK